MGWATKSTEDVKMDTDSVVKSFKNRVWLKKQCWRKILGSWEDFAET